MRLTTLVKRNTDQPYSIAVKNNGLQQTKRSRNSAETEAEKST